MGSLCWTMNCFERHFTPAAIWCRNVKVCGAISFSEAFQRQEGMLNPCLVRPGPRRP